MSGDIYFKKETKQMLRVLNGTIEKFPNPVLQVSQQKLQLQQFLKINHLPEIPIYTLVVFVSRKGILHIEPNDHFHLRNVITLQEFIFKYQKLHEILTHTVWKDTDLALAKELFLREHTSEKKLI
nr:NERD domain-containing protein [Piscibacillus salipiscarius]